MHPLWPKIEAFHPQLWRVVCGYELDPALREELYQEVLLAIWQSLPRLREPDRLRFYALRIAHNLGASHARQAAGLPTALSFDEAAHGFSGGDPDKARKDWLFEALSRLPLNLRQVLMLQLEGFDYGEIAEFLGISTDNVGIRLHRARQQLKRMTQEATSDEHE